MLKANLAGLSEQSPQRSGQGRKLVTEAQGKTSQDWKVAMSSVLDLKLFRHTLNIPEFSFHSAKGLSSIGESKLFLMPIFPIFC